MVKIADRTQFLWDRKVALALDCFICRRAHRSHFLEADESAGRCASGQRAGEETPEGVFSFSDTSLTHPTSARIAGFNSSAYRATGHRQAQLLRCDVDHWWAPFDDLVTGRPGRRLSAHPWVRLSFNTGCRDCFDKGDRDALSKPGRQGFQTNQVYPVVCSCPGCGRALATVESAPAVTLVSAPG
ncbi:hypothetical protein [Streptomyces sp. CT34]|uniref:hypothetical protein n=1 Tax=Streptomyces sp. CT34 TaxID=1553907 RepID=UPI0012FEDC34|nr:hypothetical protein [Streptomyces sp. CT34]